MKNLHPVYRVISGAEFQKGQIRTRVSTFLLGFSPSQFYDFGRNKKGNFKDNALTNELGIPPTRVIHALAGGARGREQN